MTTIDEVISQLQSLRRRLGNTRVVVDDPQGRFCNFEITDTTNGWVLFRGRDKFYEDDED